MARSPSSIPAICLRDLTESPEGPGAETDMKLALHLRWGDFQFILVGRGWLIRLVGGRVCPLGFVPNFWRVLGDSIGGR